MASPSTPKKSKKAKKAKKAKKSKKRSKESSEPVDRDLSPSPSPSTSKSSKKKEGKDKSKDKAQKSVTGVKRGRSDSDTEQMEGDKFRKTAESKVRAEHLQPKKNDEDTLFPVCNYPVHPYVVDRLLQAGITHLFPIQHATFGAVIQNKDVIGRARTGTGKTLAFALPITERLRRLVNEGTLDGHGRRGRAPAALILTPTRELARQVCDQFQLVGSDTTIPRKEETKDLKSHHRGNYRPGRDVPVFNCTTVYGGVPYGVQESAMRRGVDIVVGTTGRVKDMIERRALRLDRIQVLCLDEADMMLDMGFADDVETILAAIESARNEGGEESKKEKPTLQTLLFSATLPAWVQKVTDKYIRKNPSGVTDKVVLPEGFAKTPYVYDDTNYRSVAAQDTQVRAQVDLVHKQKLKAASTIEHIAIQCFPSERSEVISDILKVYTAGIPGARTIIFTETKRDANEFAIEADLNETVQALHGDIAQKSRDTTLAGFKNGNFRVLVATDVAARGLDISGVELVIQMRPPRDVETYIHRSGRTGRANKSGISVLLFTPRDLHLLQRIEKQAGVKFTRRGVPQRREIVAARLSKICEESEGVSEGVLKLFDKSAESVLAQFSDPKEALTRVMAVLTGMSTDEPDRSLLSSTKGKVTVLFKLTDGETMRASSLAWSILRKYVFNRHEEEANKLVWGMRLYKDMTGCVFDIPSAEVPRLKEFGKPEGDEEDSQNGNGYSRRRHWYLEVADALPELQDIQARRGGYGGGGGRGYGGGGGGRRYGRGGGRGYGGGGGGRRYGGGGGRGYGGGGGGRGYGGGGGGGRGYGGGGGGRGYGGGGGRGYGGGGGGGYGRR